MTNNPASGSSRESFPRDRGIAMGDASRREGVPLQEGVEAAPLEHAQAIPSRQPFPPHPHDLPREPSDAWPRAPVPFPIFERRGVPDDINRMDRDIEQIADRLIADLDRAKRTSATPGLKPEDVRFLAHTLVVHRTRRGGVLSEHHLRLLYAALGIQRQSVRAANFVGLPPVEDLAKFYAAADLQACEPNISINRLASEVKVERKTICAWRKLKEFKERVRFIRYLKGNPRKKIGSPWHLGMR